MRSQFIGTPVRSQVIVPQVSYVQNQHPLKTSLVKVQPQIVQNLNNSVVTQPVAQTLGAPQPQTWIEYVPIQKTYTDYEPVITHEQIPYDRQYVDTQYTALGNPVEVTKTVTDYQTIQHTNYQPIQVPYTDYKQVEHKTEYQPHVTYETIVEHVPTVRTQQIPNAVGPAFRNVTDYVAHERVQQKVEYSAITSQTVVAESTVQQPVVQCPHPSQVVVQQSIHEVSQNVPQQVNASQVVQQLPQVANQVSFAPQYLPQKTIYAPQVVNQSYVAPSVSYVRRF